MTKQTPAPVKTQICSLGEPRCPLAPGLVLKRNSLNKGPHPEPKAQGPSKCEALCDCTGRTQTKPALPAYYFPPSPQPRHLPLTFVQPWAGPWGTLKEKCSSFLYLLSFSLSQPRQFHLPTSLARYISRCLHHQRFWAASFLLLQFFLSLAAHTCPPGSPSSLFLPQVFLTRGTSVQASSISTPLFSRLSSHFCLQCHQTSPQRKSFASSLGLFRSLTVILFRVL